MDRTRLLSCVPEEGEDCAPLLLGGHTLLTIPPRIGDAGVEPFATTSSSNTVVIILIIAIVVVILAIILVAILAARARRRSSALEKEDEETRKRHRDEDEALEDELAAADVEEEEQEIIVLREKRPYVVGYGRSDKERLPVSDDVPDRGGRSGRIVKRGKERRVEDAQPVY